LAVGHSDQPQSIYRELIGLEKAIFGLKSGTFATFARIAGPTFDPGEELDAFFWSHGIP